MLEPIINTNKYILKALSNLLYKYIKEMIGKKLEKVDKMNNIL